MNLSLVWYLFVDHGHPADYEFRRVFIPYSQHLERIFHRETLLEKHGVGVIGTKRSEFLAEYFGEELRRCAAENRLPLPVVPTPHLRPEIYAIFNVEEKGYTKEERFIL